jgi:hypothetical protein
VRTADLAAGRYYAERMHTTLRQADETMRSDGRWRIRPEIARWLVAFARRNTAGDLEPVVDTMFGLPFEVVEDLAVDYELIRA